MWSQRMGEKMKTDSSIPFLFPWCLQAGKTWIPRGCTQSCTCIGGAVQCQNSECPPGTYCKDNIDGSGSCVEISKGAMGGGWGGGAQGWESLRQGKKKLNPNLRG